MTKPGGQLVYGTCVALGGVGALLRGPSGSGKSDLALRFVLDAPPWIEAALVGDDQLLVESIDGRLIARPPAIIAGKIEVRGLGILALPYRAEAEVRLLVDLTEPEGVPRLPEPRTGMLAGRALPLIALAPFEASAPLKLRLALQQAAAGPV